MHGSIEDAALAVAKFWSKAMTTKKARDTKASGTRVQVPRKDLAELAAVSHDTAEREQAGRKELEKRCRHLGKVVEESAATIRILRGQLKPERNERKWAERDIRAALKYAENIIATVPRPFLILSAGLRVISANRSFYRDFKVTPEETAGQFIYDLGNRQWDIPELRDLLEHILPEHTTVEGFEITHDFPDLGRRVMVLNARRVYRSHDEPPLILLVMEDATQRKKAQEELEENTTRRLDIAVEASQIGIWELDLISDTSIRNLRHDQIFGYEKVLAEWGANTFFEHIIPEDRPSVKAAFDGAMKTGKLFFECRIIWPDKSIHWITASGKAFGDSTEPVAQRLHPSGLMMTPPGS